MSGDAPDGSQAHDAPLLHLVEGLEHLRGTSIAERVRRLRYKRRKVPAGEVQVQAASAAEGAGGEVQEAL